MAPHAQALRIGFLTTLGVNVGDDFIREGIRYCLDRTGIPYEPYFVNKHDPSTLTRRCDGESAPIGDKIRDSDVFIQSGAPVYWHQGEGRHQSTMAEWHGWAWEERILGTAQRPLFLNLGAGSCQPWGDNGDSFVADPACARFAVRAGARAALTVPRDPVASSILERLGVAHQNLPCPAFLAAGRYPGSPAHPALIGVNLMPQGGHFDFTGSFDVLAWIGQIEKLLGGLRRMGRLLFICHDAAEARFAASFLAPGERAFLAASYREYLDVFPRLTCLFSNRVHAAVTAAGFGVPSMIAGSDTRARIGEWIGLDVRRAEGLDGREAASRMAELVRDRAGERERLLALRESTAAEYVNRLLPILSAVRPAPVHWEPAPERSAAERWLAWRTDGEPWTDRLGMEPLAVLPERGFHAPEAYGGATLRWTDGQARLEIPEGLRVAVEGVELQLWPVHPAGHWFRILVNGENVLAARTGAGGGWEGEARFPVREVRTVEILSDVLRPAGDCRTLGVALRCVRLRRALY